MELTVFKSITTAEALEAFKANGEKYEGLFVDMDNDDERRFVKSQSADIKGLIKKVNRFRIDEKKRLGDMVEKEAATIIDTLEAANKPYTLLEDAYKAERAIILANEKAALEAKELALQIPLDHEEAIMYNKVYALERAEKLEAARLAQIKLEADAKEAAKKELLQQQEEEKKKLERDELQRKANIEHVTAVCTGAKQALMDNASITEQQAIEVVKAIRKNLITNVSIKF